MKSFVLWSLAFIACVCAAWSALRTGVHDFPEDRCASCHVSAPVKGDPRSRVMKAPVSALCGECHRPAKNALSHPVEFSPAGLPLPADLPLSWDGKLTCSTCHDVHASSPPGGNDSSGSLRRRRGREFCEACHRQGGSEPIGAPGHSQVLAAAHMEFDSAQSGRIDAVSELCLSCHDGTMTPVVVVKIGSFRHGVRPADTAQELSHPVGVNYRRAMRRRGGLHPPESLDRRIMLVNGRVSCASCHNMFSRERNLLTVENDRAGLCLACHDK